MCVSEIERESELACDVGRINRKQPENKKNKKSLTTACAVRAEYLILIRYFGLCVSFISFCGQFRVFYSFRSQHIVMLVC